MLETNVLAMEITMAIPNVSVPLSFGEFIFVVSYKCTGVRHEQPKHLLVNGNSGEGLDLFEILFYGGTYGFDTSEFSSSVRRDILMKQSQCSAHVLHCTIKGPSLTDQFEEKTVEGDTFHFY